MQNRRQRVLLVVLVLLGAAVGVAPPALAQTFTEFPIPTADGAPIGITTGPDGALWFTEVFANKIGRLVVNSLLSLAASVNQPTFAVGRRAPSRSG